MAEKIQFGEVVNATIKASNASDTKRTYDITADVTIDNKNVTGINNGQVYPKSEAQPIAYFSAGAYGYLNLNFNDTKTIGIDKQIEILTAINNFIADTVSSAPIESPIV